MRSLRGARAVLEREHAQIALEPIALEPESDLKYAAHFEVLPEVKLNPIEALTIEKPVATVNDADVDAMVENMRVQRPVYTPVERPARVVIAAAPAEADGDR